MEILKGLTPEQERVVDAADTLALTFLEARIGSWVGVTTTTGHLVLVVSGPKADQLRREMLDDGIGADGL